MRHLALMLFVTAGCAEPCLDLATKICRCDSDTRAASICVARAEAQSANTNTSSSEDDRCEALIDTCRCDALNTPEGRIACGLSREPQ